jgi:hypothetical protein
MKIPEELRRGELITCEYENGPKHPEGNELRLGVVLDVIPGDGVIVQTSFHDPNKPSDKGIRRFKTSKMVAVRCYGIVAEV